MSVLFSLIGGVLAFELWGSIDLCAKLVIRALTAVLVEPWRGTRRAELAPLITPCAHERRISALTRTITTTAVLVTVDLRFGRIRGLRASAAACGQAYLGSLYWFFPQAREKMDPESFVLLYIFGLGGLALFPLSGLLAFIAVTQLSVPLVVVVSPLGVLLALTATNATEIIPQRWGEYVGGLWAVGCALSLWCVGALTVPAWRALATKSR